MKNFVQEGDALTLTAPVGGVLSGVGYKIGDAFVVATADVAAGLPFVGVRVGVVELAKTAAQAWTEGAAINFNNTSKEATTVTTGNYKIGFAAAVAENPSDTGLVVLHGGNLGAALS